MKYSRLTFRSLGIPIATMLNLNNIKTKSALQKYMAMRFLVRPMEFAKPRPSNAPPWRFCPAGRKARGTGCSNPPLLLPHKIHAVMTPG